MLKFSREDLNSSLRGHVVLTELLQRDRVSHLTVSNYHIFAIVDGWRALVFDVVSDKSLQLSEDQARDLVRCATGESFSHSVPNFLAIQAGTSDLYHETIGTNPTVVEGNWFNVEHIVSLFELPHHGSQLKPSESSFDLIVVGSKGGLSMFSWHDSSSSWHRRMLAALTLTKSNQIVVSACLDAVSGCIYWLEMEVRSDPTNDSCDSDSDAEHETSSDSESEPTSASSAWKHDAGRDESTYSSQMRTFTTCTISMPLRLALLHRQQNSGHSEKDAALPYSRVILALQADYGKDTVAALQPAPSPPERAQINAADLGSGSRDQKLGSRDPDETTSGESCGRGGHGGVWLFVEPRSRSGARPAPSAVSRAWYVHAESSNPSEAAAMDVALGAAWTMEGKGGGLLVLRPDGVLYRITAHGALPPIQEVVCALGDYLGRRAVGMMWVGSVLGVLTLEGSLALVDATTGALLEETPIPSRLGPPRAFPPRYVAPTRPVPRWHLIPSPPADADGSDGGEGSGRGVWAGGAGAGLQALVWAEGGVGLLGVRAGSRREQAHAVRAALYAQGRIDFPARFGRGNGGGGGGGGECVEEEADAQLLEAILDLHARGEVDRAAALCEGLLEGGVEEEPLLVLAALPADLTRRLLQASPPHILRPGRAYPANDDDIAIVAPAGGWAVDEARGGRGDAVGCIDAEWITAWLFGGSGGGDDDDGWEDRGWRVAAEIATRGGALLTALQQAADLRLSHDDPPPAPTAAPTTPRVSVDSARLATLIRAWHTARTASSHGPAAPAVGAGAGGVGGKGQSLTRSRSMGSLPASAPATPAGRKAGGRMYRADLPSGSSLSLSDMSTADAPAAAGTGGGGGGNHDCGAGQDWADALFGSHHASPGRSGGGEVEGAAGDCPPLVAVVGRLLYEISPIHLLPFLKLFAAFAADGPPPRQPNGGRPAVCKRMSTAWTPDDEAAAAAGTCPIWDTPLLGGGGGAPGDADSSEATAMAAGGMAGVCWGIPADVWRRTCGAALGLIPTSSAHGTHHLSAGGDPGGVEAQRVRAVAILMLAQGRGLEYLGTLCESGLWADVPAFYSRLPVPPPPRPVTGSSPPAAEADSPLAIAVEAVIRRFQRLDAARTPPYYPTPSAHPSRDDASAVRATAGGEEHHPPGRCVPCGGGGAAGDDRLMAALILASL